MISLLKRWRKPSPVETPAQAANLHAFARADSLFESGRMREAQAAYREAISLGIDDASVQRRLGQALLATGDVQDAEAALRRAAGNGNGDVPASLALALLLREQRRDDEADALLALRPDDVYFMLARGDLRAARGDYSGAEAIYRAIVAKDDARALAWNGLGAALERQGRIEDAHVAFANAMRCAADDEAVDIFVNHAITLRNVGRYADAIAVYEHELPKHPSIRGYRAYATALLSMGNLAEAWPFYEFRWIAPPQLSQRPHFARPVWRGQALAGKTILLRAEQGHGDVIQFARYAPMVKALGGTVMLVVPQATLELAKSVPGVDRVLGPGEASPDFDFHVPLLSLPLIFGTTLATIPANIPYVAIDPVRAKRWASRVAKTKSVLRVGLAWEGSPDNLENHLRSIPLAALARLSDVAGVTFHGLQKDARAVDESAAAALRLIPLGADFRDFADTAAAMGELDLVISVCTSVAHLAGALGRPAWVLLHSAADWRWLSEREDSPWYPTARLFRQRRRGDWDEVVTRVKAALEEVVAGRAALPPVPDSAPSQVTLQVARPRTAPGHRPGLAAVAETRYGILQYLPDVDEMLGWYGEWRQGALDLLAGWVAAGSTVVEIGAGTGAHALVLGEWCGAQGQVLAEEPDPVARRLLGQNVAANAARSVTVLRQAMAAGGVDGMELGQLALLKVNDAGRSQAVLAGADATLWRLRPVLYLQADGAGIEGLAEVVRGYGYRCFAHTAPVVAARNFNRRDVAAEDACELLALVAVPEERALTVALPDCRELS